MLALKTPWGTARRTWSVAPGVDRVEARNGTGIMLSEERWESLPPGVRECLTLDRAAGDHDEAAVVMTALGLATPWLRDLTVSMARGSERYAPTVDALERTEPEGCYTCGNPGPGTRLASRRWICHDCIRERGQEELAGLARTAVRAAR